MKYYVYLLKNIKRIKKRVCKSNHILKRKAMSTHNYYKSSSQTTMEQMLKILAYKYTDDMLSALYQGAIESLKGLGKDAIMLLRWHAYDADRKQLCLQYGYSMRTMYRKTKALLDKFAHKMTRLGYSVEWFDQQKARLGLCA